MSLLGRPPGDFPLPIFDVVLNAKTVRGSIVDTRAGRSESLAFAGDGLVKSHYLTDRLNNINAVFERMEAGSIDVRVRVTL